MRLGAYKVILGCRDLDKGMLAKKDIKTSLATSGIVEVWQLDLGSFESVKDFARRAQGLDRLDAIIESAGVLSTEFEDCEGWERQITVNVISTFLLTFLLLPTLRRCATKFNVTPHIVVVSSDAHVSTSFRARNAPSILETLRGSDDMSSRYGDSKLLQILIVRELAKELRLSSKPQIVLNTLSPGLCRSQLFRNASWPLTWFMPISLLLLGRTSEMGSRVLLTAASAGAESHGRYFEDCKPHEESRFVRSDDGQRMQKKVYKEALVILDGIVPGIPNNI